jgi:hypothetical protein
VVQVAVALALMEADQRLVVQERQVKEIMAALKILYQAILVLAVVVLVQLVVRQQVLMKQVVRAVMV